MCKECYTCYVKSIGYNAHDETFCLQNDIKSRVYYKVLERTKEIKAIEQHMRRGNDNETQK